MRALPVDISNSGWRVRLLGGPQVEGPDGPIKLPGGKPLELLVYLLLFPEKRHTREQLADRLWPETPSDRGGRYLSNALYRLNKARGERWFDSDEDGLRLNLHSDLWVDVWAFKQLAQQDNRAALEQAVALYRGDLLPEIYSDWILPHRAEVREWFLTLLERLGQAAEEHGKYDTAFAHYHRLAQADPFNESGQRGLMRLYARLGRHSAALQQYDRLTRQLNEELQTEPLPDTRALAEAIRAEMGLRQRAAAGDHPTPFVGRVAERARLLERLEQAGTGQGGVLVVLGEAGIGKTRLLQELENAARWRGWQVAWGRTDEFALPAPYAPLSGALRATLPQPRREQLAQLIAPHWLALAAHLAPELEPAHFSAPPITGPAQLAVAVHHLLMGLHQIAPHLFLLDDCHWADDSFWSLLDALREPLQQLAVFVVISGRGDELRRLPTARTHLEQWDRAGIPVIQLGGLGPEALSELGPALTPAQRVALQTASGGNPLIALTLLQADDPKAFSAQPRLTHLFERRLAALSPETRRALEAAAVLGYHFPYLLWHGLVSDSALPVRAGELEQSKLIALEHDGYRFAHDALRSIVYSQISPPVRSELHQTALDILTQQASADVLTLLHHAEQAGALTEVARYAQRAGEQALASYGALAAVRHFQRALSTSSASASARYAAWLGLARAYDVLADREAQRASLKELQNLAEALKDDSHRAQIAWMQASLEWSVGEYAQALSMAEAGLKLTRQTGDLTHQAALLEAAGRIARDLGDYAKAQVSYEEARAIYRQLRDVRGEALVMDALGIVAQRRGQSLAAAALHASAQAAFQSIGDLFQELRATTNLAIALWLGGDLLQAQTMLEHGRRLAHEAGDRKLEQAALTNLGSIAGSLGRHDAAIEFCEQALNLARASNDASALSIPLANLAESYFQMGRMEKALTTFDEALTLNQAIGRKRGEGYARHGRGHTLLELGRVAEGRAELEAARTLRAELGERDNLIETHAMLALAYAAEGQAEKAQAMVALALEDLREEDDPSLCQRVHYIAFRLRPAEVARHHLRLAEAAMRAISATLPSEARDHFLQNVLINRQTRAALDAVARKIQLRLARASAPLGKTLAAEGLIEIMWTVEALDDEGIVDRTERRRHRLKRLLAEAAVQGASPTDGDLAQALGVARRTIERDMLALHQAGFSLSTRRRKK